jgi:hypothetical protein
MGRRRRRGRRISKVVRAGLLTGVLAIVWGHDTGIALAEVTSPRPLTFQQLFGAHPPGQPRVSVIPTHVKEAFVLE